MNIGFFKTATDVFLEVEVNSKSASDFEAEYKAVTGVKPEVGTGYQIQSNKWGREVRVYFNNVKDLTTEFTKVGAHLEKGDRPYRSGHTYRVNDRNFFWELVKAGYRLGNN